MLNIIFLFLSIVAFALAIDTWSKRRDLDSRRLMRQLFILVLINLINVSFSYLRNMNIVVHVTRILLLIITIWVGFYMIKTIKKVW